MWRVEQNNARGASQQLFDRLERRYRPFMPFSSDPMRDTERYKAMRDALRDATSADASPSRRRRRERRRLRSRWRRATRD
jgi:hypothetical protein